MKKSAFFRAVILIAILVTVICLPSVKSYANYTLSLGFHDVRGIVPKGISSPLKLKNAEITFNVPEFPETNYASESIAAAEYDASVVTKYVFYNPKEDTVTDTLLFPMGELPEYIGEIDAGKTVVNDLSKYGVKVNGKTSEITVRHTAGDSSRYIMDNYCETSPFTDYTVTHYRYKLIADCSCECIVALYADDGDKNRRMIAYEGNKYYGVLGVEDYFELSVDPTDAESVIDIWCIGEPMDDAVKAEFFVSYDDTYRAFGRINATLELQEKKTMSFTEFAFSTYDPNSGVSEVDHYNAVIDTVGSNDYINRDFKNFDSTLYRWYQFDVTVPAGKTATVETIAPLYPDINDNYTPFIYNYDCDIYNTVMNWSDIQGLTATVVTPYHSVTLHDESGLKKTENGYSYVFTEPYSRWEFTLSTSPTPEHNFREPEPKPNPEEPPYKVIFTALLLLPLIAAVIISVILQLKRDEGLSVAGVLCDIWLWFVKIAVPIHSIAVIWQFADCVYEKIRWGDGNLWLIISCSILFGTVILSKLINRFRKETAWKRVDKIVLNIYLLLPVASLFLGNLLADFIFFYL